MRIKKEGDDVWLNTDWESDEKDHLTDSEITQIQTMFKDNGYHVSKRGIRH